MHERSRSRASTPPTSSRARSPVCATPAPRLPGGGLAVCALDTELLGHWWYEGFAWLAAVVEECSRQGLELVRLDDALERASSRRRLERDGEAWQASSWGKDGDLSTWSGPAVAEMAFAVRAAELAARGRGRGACTRGGARAAGAAGQRLAVHGLARHRRPLRARALRRPPRGARARALRRRGARASRPAQPRRVRRPHGAAVVPVEQLTPSASSAGRRACGSRAPARRRRRRSRARPSVTTELVPMMLLSPTLTPRSTHAP